MDYKSSGVDIEAGDAFVENLKKKVPSIGGFNGAFKIPDIEDYDEPELISGTDVEGTKIHFDLSNIEDNQTYTIAINNNKPTAVSYTHLTLPTKA